MTANAPYYPRSFMARAIFTWLFLVLVYFMVNHTLLSQMQQPVLVAPGSDNTFWLLHILNIPQFLLRHHWAALSFDIVLTTACLICVFVPAQRWFTWITVIGVWILYICYCSAAGKHYAQIGYLLPPLAFLALAPVKFDMAWQLVRYWVCFLYVSAGLYKLYYGGFTTGGHMANILAETNAGWFMHHTDGMQAGTIRYLAEHPALSQWLYRLTTLVDLSLLAGFFTRRFDGWLVSGLIIFHTANFFLLHISFIEQSLIFAPFLPWVKWATYIQSKKGND